MSKISNPLNIDIDSAIIGGPLDRGVINQLTARKNIISKRHTRTKDDILYLNSNTGWVKLSSSINIEIPKVIKTGEVISPTEVPKYSSELAKNNVLLGGTLYEGKELQAGFDPDTGAYKKSNLYGERPMPGITSMTVSSKNQFGTLREGKVEFKANSIEQLDDLEQIYLRPGYTILLEWGHSMYVGNNNEVNTLISSFSDYFTGQSKSVIQSKIQTLKKNSSYNYDAMFGFIKNFSWSFNVDGTYNCSVDIISPGELIESIQTIISPNTGDDTPPSGVYKVGRDGVTIITDSSPVPKYDPFEPKFQFSEQFPDDPTSFYDGEIKKSILHRYLITIKNYTEKTDAAAALTKYVPTYYNKIKSNLENNKQAFDFIEFDVNSIDSKGTSIGESRVKLIPLHHLLELVNIIYMVTDQEGENIIKFYTGNKEEKIKTQFLTYFQHFALDPTIAVLPKGDQNTEYNYAVASKCKVESKFSNDILNIYVGIDHILSILDETITTPHPTQSTIFKFVKELLATIQKTMGGINEFDFHYDEDEFTYYIVDRKVVPRGDALKNSGSSIDLVGLNSMLENLSFTSKLSSNITTMMAISAQYGSTDLGTDTGALLNWNKGIQDRHLVTKNIGSPIKTEGIPEKTTIVNVKDGEQLVLHLHRANDQFNNLNALIFDTNALKAIIPHHTSFTTSFVEYTTKEQNTNPAGIIPFELSFTIKGIAGIKIGQSFLVPNEVIPKKYKDRIAFLVTGVSNSIKSGRWVTDIKTQMITTATVTGTKEELDLTAFSDEAFTEKILGGYAAVPMPKLKYINPLGKKDLNTRNDDEGKGVWTSPRKNKITGKITLHKAWDVLVTKGDLVYCPFPGTITWNAPYSKGQKIDTTTIGRFRITGTGQYAGIIMILGYVTKFAGEQRFNGKTVIQASTVIGRMGSVSESYQSTIMLDHLHIYVKKGNGIGDPSKIIWDDVEETNNFVQKNALGF